MALRSIGMQLMAMPNRNFCNLRSALCLATAAATTGNRKSCQQFRQTQQSNNQQQDFCEQFYKYINKACYKRSTLIKGQALAWNPTALVTSQQTIPNLDLKPPIRKVTPVSKEITKFSYISPEFKELLRKHDEEMKQKYILSFLPAKYTTRISERKLEERNDEIKPYCICEGLKAAKAKANPKTKKRNFLKYLSCCTTRGADSNDGSKKCQCSKGKKGECEMCSQRLTKESISKKNLKKSKEKNVKLSTAKSAEKLKQKNELKTRYWVGTIDETEKYAAKQEVEDQKSAKGKQKKRSCALKQLTKKFKKSGKSKKIDKNRK